MQLLLRLRGASLIPHDCVNLCQLLNGRAAGHQLSLAEWNTVIQLARSANVLGILFHRLDARDELSKIPSVVQWHLSSAAVIAEKYRRDAVQEVERLWPILHACDQPLILLKGAAYVLGERAFAKGRTFSDIDILVPKANLSYVESQLQWLGWGSSHHSDYDQRYYREWMHELPPLVHAKRGTVLDLHHTILPLTASLKPDADKLLKEAQAFSEHVSTLSSIDQVLHTATHLFMDSEFDHAFRDLLDFDGLMRELKPDDDLLDQIIGRAASLDLLPPLYYAMRYSRLLFETPIPDSAMLRVSEAWTPKLGTKIMDWLFIPVLLPPHTMYQSSLRAYCAKKLLFIRGHALRMPAHLLIRHLSFKAFVAPFIEEKKPSS